ncbi:MAG: NAD(P)-binding protein [Bryobacteraceae bacterium]|jgi:spermidine dehydrogenase
MSDRQPEKDLGMQRPIARRDFLNGAAMAAGAAAWLLGMEQAGKAAQQDAPGYYPPALTGMRGSPDGSFEAAHALRDGTFWKTAGQPIDTRETYDLIVVGGGISGLAAAYFFRARTGRSARILILDNHDDFGGHAKRNELSAGGRMLLANGGTWAIESPYPYSPQAHGLMTDLGIDPAALEAKCVDQNVYRGLGQATFFDKETFGVDRLATGSGSGAKLAEFLAQTPLSAAAQSDMTRLQNASVDYMPGLSQSDKKARLSRMSYKDFLLNLVKVDAQVVRFYQTRPHDLFGVGIDAVSALDCWAMHYPGFQGMALDRVPTQRVDFTPGGDLVEEAEPYYFHFPDGNASIARLLVRALIPGVAPGNTAEDVVTAKFDYTRLDQKDLPVRIRLNSTAVRARNLGDPASAKEVEVAYVRDKQVYTVRGKAAIMACWNMVVPYVCPELPEPQKQALQYGAKVPLVYTVVAARNWTAFRKLGVRGVSSPGMYHLGVHLDQPVSVGGYRCPQSPEEPMLLRMTRTPCKPGLPEREQHRFGRVELLTTPFATFELKIRDQLARILGPGGFDPARDITAITVNRWPHGYAYEYNALWDPDWPAGQRPCEIGRKRFGRIAIANSDAAAAAYTDQAIDQGYRAVQELLA